MYISGNCENREALYSGNDGWSFHLASTEIFPEAAALLVINVRPKAAEALGPIDELISDLQTARNHVLRGEIDDRVKKAAGIACDQCSGPVVDLTTGEMYCGREVPQSVLDSNSRHG